MRLTAFKSGSVNGITKPLQRTFCTADSVQAVNRNFQLILLQLT